MVRTLSIILLIALSLVACVPTTEVADIPPAVVGEISENPTQVKLTESPSQTPSPTETEIPSQTATFTPSPTPTRTPTPTATWVFNEAGEVIAPILLYHHIADGEPFNRYYVSIESFRTQMQALIDWGYTSIPISLLLDAIIDGAELPPRPVVITFDDGALDVFENAFPIMQEMGFTGVFYIVSNRLESDGFVDADILAEMMAAGWEIGSHSQTHQDLTLDHNSSRDEILVSKNEIEDALGIDIQTFAYPFGKVDDYIIKRPNNLGYRGAVGLGKSYTHTWGTIFYLDRIEIHGDFTIDDLASRIPWPDNFDIP